MFRCASHCSVPSHVCCVGPFRIPNPLCGHPPYPHSPPGVPHGCHCTQTRHTRRGGAVQGRLSVSQILRENHLEERLSDQAQAQALYTPPLGGHSRSIPQGMIFDVQPLVKSLFCPIRPSPMDFLILRLLSPETEYHFWGGLGGDGGGVGGGWSKVCAQKDLNEGQIGHS